MKKLIAAAGLGAAVAVSSLAGAGTANASEDGYLNFVYNKTGYYPADYEHMQTSVAVGTHHLSPDLHLRRGRHVPLDRPGNLVRVQR